MRKFRGFTALLACIAVVAASLVVASTTADALITQRDHDRSADHRQQHRGTGPRPGQLSHRRLHDMQSRASGSTAAIDALREQRDPGGAGHPQPPAQRLRGCEGVGSGRRAHPGVSRPDGDHQGPAAYPRPDAGLRVVPGCVQGPADRPGTGGRRPVPQMVRSHDGHHHQRPRPSSNRLALATARSVPRRRSTAASGRSTAPTTRRMLPSATGKAGAEQCAGLATGCPIPWPSVEQFQQWGRYVSQQKLLDDPVFVNMAMEVSAGVGLAATMAATGVATAVARRTSPCP